jgi:CheY-like chemotaxis protein
MSTVRPPPVVLVLGTGACDPTPLPFSELATSQFQIVDQRREPDGIAAACTLQPDVVLVDVGQSHVKGLELCRALQAEPGTREIPLIAITGDAAIGQFMMTLRVKACDPHSLKDEIWRVLADAMPPVRGVH